MHGGSAVRLAWKAGARRVPVLAVSAAGAALVAWVLWGLGRAYVRVGILHEAPSAFRASGAWGLVLLASFCGFGSAVDALLRPPRADWGLRCAWGWAVAVALGGLLCALGLATAGVLVGLAGVGIVLLAVDRVLGYRRWQRRCPVRWTRARLARWPFAAGVAAVFALAGCTYLATIVNAEVNDNDDRLCYFAFAREILQRGTLSQPFSLRRLSAYGAKSLLDAMQLSIPVPDAHLHLLDGGMALLTMLALLVGCARASRVVVLLLLLLTVTLPEIRINTAATMTGAVFFFALYRTLARRPVEETRGWRDAVPVALLAAGASALRQNYLVPVACLLILEYARPIARSLTLRPFGVDRTAVARSAVAAGLLALFLLPWWVMSLRWTGTFLFPFAHGHFNLDYAFFEPLKPFEELHYVWQNAAYCLPVKAVPLLLVAALGSSRVRRSSTLQHFVLAAFAGFAVLLRAYPDADPPNLGRYYFGFTFAALLAIALEAVTEHPGATGRARTESVAALALVVSALALQIYGDREATAQAFDQALARIQPAVESPTPWRPREPDKDYATLQNAIPAGEPIVVMVDEAGNFDFRRNRIESLDLVGAVAPPPGLPLRAGGEAVAEYLVAKGYRYAIVVHPDAAKYLYRRDTWQRNLAPSAQPVSQHTAHHYLEAFDAFDALRKTRLHLADAGPMTALDLTRPQ